MGNHERAIQSMQSDFGKGAIPELDLEFDYSSVKEDFKDGATDGNLNCWRDGCFKAFICKKGGNKFNGQKETKSLHQLRAFEFLRGVREDEPIAVCHSSFIPAACGTLAAVKLSSGGLQNLETVTLRNFEESDLEDDACAREIIRKGGIREAELY